MSLLRKQSSIQDKVSHYPCPGKMNYTSSITVDTCDPDKLIEAFKHEDGEGDRASWQMFKKKEGVEFRITAKDSTALRAVLNSITKLLTVYEKVK